MADQERVHCTEPLSQAGSDDEEEEEEGKRLLVLMERLRNKDKVGSYKSWHDTSKLLKHSVTDKHHQGDAEDKNALQKEITSLTKAVKVNSMTSLIDQLEQSTKRVGMSVVTAAGSNHVTLKAEMFEVHLSMESTGKVKDVFISHDGISHNREAQGCEDAAKQELTQLLRDDRYEELNQHLEGLVTIYAVSGDRAQKSKAFLALQSLETDLNMLSKMQSTISSVANYIHKSPLGILQPRIGGIPMQMTYFVGPYDLLCPSTRSFCPMTVEAILEKKVGFRVSVGIMTSDNHILQTMPLIMDGKSIPSFSALNKINSCSLPAVFVLKLHQSMPLSWSLIQKITNTTGVDFVDKKKLKSLMTLLIQHVRKKDLLEGSNQNGLHVHLPDQRHSYFLHPWPGGTEQEGAVVTEIPFTHPTHVAAILNCLRQQVLFNTLVSSCVRTATPHNGESCWTFELAPGALTSLTVSFEHPCSDTIATVEIDLSDVTSVKCHIVADVASPDSTQDTFCTDESATKVLQRCLSLPVTLRWILHQALAHLQQKLSTPSPRLDLESSVFSTPSGMFDVGGHSGLSNIGMERRQAFIDAHNRNQLPWNHMNNVIKIYSTGSTCKEPPCRGSQMLAPLTVPMDITPPEPAPDAFDQFGSVLTAETEESDKVSRNPMLASLLGQDTKSPQSVGNATTSTGDGSPSASSGSGAQPPPQQHSVLCALLGDSTSPTTTPSQQQQLSQQQQQLSQQQQQLSHQQQQLSQQQHHQQHGSHLHHFQQQQQQQQQQSHPAPPSLPPPPPPLHHQQIQHHQLQHHPPNLQHPSISQASLLADKQKRPRKRKSIGDRIAETSRAPKRKPSEDELRRDLAMFNVDGSSSSSIEAVSVKGSNSIITSGNSHSEPSSFIPKGNSDTSLSTSPVYSNHGNNRATSESHVNRLASTMDSIIKQETRAPPGVVHHQSLGGTDSSVNQSKDKRFKSESDTPGSGGVTEDTSTGSGGGSKISRSYSDSDGAFANNKLSLKIKTEKQDPFDFSSSVSYSKDLGPDNSGAGGKILKLESKVEGFTKELSGKDRNDLEKPSISLDKSDLMEPKIEPTVRFKERKKERRDLSVYEDRPIADKEKPIAITVKVNTRDLTARTIIKEPPIRSSSPAEGSDGTWKDKVKDIAVKSKTSDSATIDLTGDIESDKSSSSSTPSHGRTTPGSTPNTSPRILHGSIKRDGKERARGEKRRKSSKHNSDVADGDKKHRKHTDDSRKEQLSKKQRIYDFEADVNETDNYRVEKLASTTIKIRTNRVSHSAVIGKNSPISPAGGRSPNVTKTTGVASPLKIFKTGGDTSGKVPGTGPKQRVQGTNVQRTYPRSKSDSQSAGNTTPTNDKVDSKLCRMATIKLKPLNLTSSATVTVAPVTMSGPKTTQTPSSAPVTTTSKVNLTPSTTSGSSSNASSGGGSGTNTVTTKSSKPVPDRKSKKLLAVIDKLKKQQTTSPSGLGDGRDSDQTTSKNQAIYDAIRLQIIKEGNRTSTPTKEMLTPSLKSSHNKKEPSSKAESFKKTDFTKGGAMPSVNTSSLGTIPKTFSSQSSRQNSSSGGPTNNKQAAYPAPSVTNAHQKSVSTEHSSKGSELLNNKREHNVAVSIIASKDPRTAAHLNNKTNNTNNTSTTNTAPAASQGVKEPVVPPVGTDRNQPAAVTASAHPAKKAGKLDDISERLQKNTRHFLDAVKLPVNGSPGQQGQGQGQGQCNPQEDDVQSGSLQGHDADGNAPKTVSSEHPNHEIFTENPSSPTDDVDEEMAGVRNPPVVGYVPGKVIESRASPALVERQVTTPNLAAEGNRTTTAYVEESRTEVGGPETIKTSSDPTRPKLNQFSKNDIAKDIAQDQVEGSTVAPKPWVNKTPTTETVGPWVGQDGKDRSGSPALYNSNPAPSEKVSVPKTCNAYSKSTGSTLSSTSSGGVGLAAPVNSLPLEKKVKSVDKLPGVSSSSVAVSDSQIRCSIPCHSPVSSPEDGLVIDCPGSPKSGVSPVTIATHVPPSSSAIPRPPPSPHPAHASSSPATGRGTSPALQQLLQENLAKTSPQRGNMTPNNVTASSKVVTKTPSSPGQPHSSPVDIDDDLMDAALML